MTALSACALLATGCAGPSPKQLAATQPSNVTVAASDFDRIWAAADDVARDLLFTPARQDRRAGIYRTEPIISGQWFEPWRQEVRTIDDRTQSSLASVRRTLTVQITRDEAGQFIARPEVIVERFALSERRITTSAGYRSVFRDRRRGQYGSAEADAGLSLPDSYWYVVGNDPALEQYVARKIERRLK